MQTPAALLFSILIAQLSLCSTGGAQQLAKIPGVGAFIPASASETAHLINSLQQGLREHGYVEKQNLTLEVRYAGGKVQQLARVATELVGLKMNVLVVGSTPAAIATKKATDAIPIVIVTTGDPVASGLVASLARPGGNITGLTALGQELGGKRLEVLKETIPKVSRVAILSNPLNPDSHLSLQGVDVAARVLGVQLRLQEASDPNELEKAFKAIANDGAEALMVLADPMFISERRRIATLSAKSRLPTMYGHREYMDAGGLMFYGASLADMWRRAAIFVDKILKGAKPADLPVEQPTKFELVINLKAAKQIGLTIPPQVLARADRVIR
jgi:putative ABC transport system substrate-binding protein